MGPWAASAGGLLQSVSVNTADKRQD